ncbi:MAG: hypothetical protein IPH09_16295 [bacterium]|nr:hypothetical protein [bacterium]
MRTSSLVCAGLFLAAAAAAGPGVPAKTRPVRPAPPVAGPRVGGDTIENAVGIFTCPMPTPAPPPAPTTTTTRSAPGTAARVAGRVYAIKQSSDTYVAIDLCGSGYDTRVFVYDYLRNLVACNDDNPYAEAPCSGLDSRIDVLLLEAGIPYYIIIDGYGGGSGDYALSVSVTDNPELDCPDGAQVEGEPPMVYGIDDAYNCGCFCANPPARFQKLGIDPAGTTFACFRSGWNGIPGGNARDFDWIMTTVGPGGQLRCELVVEWPSELTVMPPFCEFTEIYGFAAVEPGASSVLELALAPGTPVWIVLTRRPTSTPGFGLPLEYDLHLTIEGQATTTANEASSWGDQGRVPLRTGTYRPTAEFP